MAMPIVPSRMQKLRGERHMFATSDDNAMMRQVQATHAPDGREFNVKPLLDIIDDIFQRAAPSIPGFAQGTQEQSDVFDDKAFQSDFFDMLDLLSPTINRISCEISCKCSGGGDAHATTLGIFNIVTSYSWDAKVVLAMAAFALNYGEFWVVAQLYPSNQLAKSVAILKQLPELLERVDSLKPRFEALSNLIKAMLDLTKCIVEFKGLPSEYIPPDTPEITAVSAHIPTAVYWIIRSIVASAGQILGLIGMGHEYVASTTESWELSSLAHKISSIYNHLMQQLKRCHQLIDEKMQIEAYQALVRLIETMHIDNIKVLRALIYAKDDQLPLVECPTKQRVSIDVLRRKIVLLLISDLEVSHEEIFILDQMYKDSRQHSSKESPYEVVWLPIVDRSTAWTDAKQDNFLALQAMMPWFSVHHPSLIDPVVIRYIKEKWSFNKKPILVVLDPQGKVVNQNAFHMMWIWGPLAYPFTLSREEALWKEETWRIDLLADTVDPVIPVWVAENKHICLYGGEDLEWIRKFTATLQAVARAAGIELEMLYVGKTNPKEKVRKIINTISMEKLGNTLPDLLPIWFFWVRLESMWHSKMKFGKSVQNDPIMPEIMTMLSFDGSDQGWAVICRGTQMAKAKDQTIVQCLNDYAMWEPNVDPLGFIVAMNDHLNDNRPPHHCNRLILPGGAGRIPERVVCAECGRPMEEFIMYRCCTD